MSFRLSAWLVIIHLIVIGQVARAQDETVVKVNSTLVVLNAVVTDRHGRHVSGLSKKDFSVFDNSAEQKISFFAAEESPFAAVVLIDTSGSMEERVTLARAAAIRFLDGLRPSDNAAIYSFDSKVSLVRPFSNSRDVPEQLFDVKAKGMTVLNDAIYEASIELEKRPEKRRAIIVLSDGMDTTSRRTEEKALKAALAANSLIYTVDMSTADSNVAQRLRNQGTLKKFADKTGGTFVATPGGAAMREAFKKIADELGLQYTLGYEPTSSERDGKWHAIELRVARPGLTIRTRKGYNAVKPS